MDKIYCSCRKKESGYMIQCDTWEEWFHYKCVGLSDESAEVLHDWMCFVCSRIQNALTNLRGELTHMVNNVMENLQKNVQNQQLLDHHSKEKKNNEELKKELNSMRNVYQELQNENKEALKDNEELKKELNNLTNVHQELENKHEVVMKNIEELQQELNNVTNVHRELENKHEEVKNENKKLKEELNNLTNVHRELENKHEKVKNENKKLKEELNNLTVHQELENESRDLKAENKTKMLDEYIKPSQDLNELSQKNDKKKVKRLSLKNGKQTKSLSQKKMKYIDDSP